MSLTHKLSRKLRQRSLHDCKLYFVDYAFLFVITYNKNPVFVIETCPDYCFKT